MLEWIRDPGNAAAVQAASAVVQAAGAIVLIWVTWVNVRVTRKISEATERQSGATERQAVATTQAVELAQQQRRDTVRPVLHLELRGYRTSSTADTLGLRLHVTNAGLGPAFDVQAVLDRTPLEQVEVGSLTGNTRPSLVRVNEGIWFDFAREDPTGTDEWWPGPNMENQIVGQILVTYHDSFDGVRSTRANLIATWHLAPTSTSRQPYDLVIDAQRFDADTADNGDRTLTTGG